MPPPSFPQCPLAVQRSLRPVEEPAPALLLGGRKPSRGRAALPAHGYLPSAQDAPARPVTQRVLGGRDFMLALWVAKKSQVSKVEKGLAYLGNTS